MEAAKKEIADIQTTIENLVAKLEETRAKIPIAQQAVLQAQVRFIFSSIS